jgi:hypothetical protein
VSEFVRAQPPQLVVVLPLEGDPRIMVDAQTEGDALRLWRSLELSRHWAALEALLPYGFHATGMAA